MTALGRLMPNIGGPLASKRRILACVAHSQLLYAAPVWHFAISKGYIRQKLKAIHRKLNLKICSAYRTVSTEALNVISGVPPIHLLVEERRERYKGTSKLEARSILMIEWQKEWDLDRYGRWTHDLIPDINIWLDRSFGETDYFLTQALTGHGCFNNNLHKRERSTSNLCMYCKEVDSVEHTLFLCNEWKQFRESFQRDSGGQVFNAKNMMQGLLSGETSWKITYRCIREIIETKGNRMRGLTA